MFVLSLPSAAISACFTQTLRYADLTQSTIRNANRKLFDKFVKNLTHVADNYKKKIGKNNSQYTATNAHGCNYVPATNAMAVDRIYNLNFIEGR